MKVPRLWQPFDGNDPSELAKNETSPGVNTPGSQYVNTHDKIEGKEFQSTAGWSGDELVLRWIDKGGTFTRRFTFSDKGRKITVNSHDSNPDGQTDDLFVFDKQ